LNFSPGAPRKRDVSESFCRLAIALATRLNFSHAHTTQRVVRLLQRARLRRARGVAEEFSSRAKNSALALNLSATEQRVLEVKKDRGGRFLR
jgi:hypothetical protein